MKAPSLAGPKGPALLVLLVVWSSGVGAQTPPDLSGVWAPYRAGRGADPKLNPPPPTPIVLKPQYAKPYEARRAIEDEAVKRGEPLATPAVSCVPYGFPRMMAVASYPAEIIQRPSQITMVTEAFSEVRRIFMNQPQLPIDEVPPGYYGHSVGKWEGDTLVVDTRGFNDQTWFDRAGNFHSDALHVVERFTPRSPETLTYDVTIEDPNVFTRPWKMSMPLYRRVESNARLMEFRCIEFAEDLLYGHLRKPGK